MTVFILVWLRLLFLNGANGTFIYSSETKLKERAYVSAFLQFPDFSFIPGN